MPGFSQGATQKQTKKKTHQLNYNDTTHFRERMSLELDFLSHVLISVHHSVWC